MVDLSWTLEDALAATDEMLRENPDRAGDPTLPVFQLSALHDLRRLKEQFEAGEKYCLMVAIYKCAIHSLVLPPWVSREYLSAFRKVHNYKVASWDDAFGVPLPKGQHLTTQREEREKSLRAYLMCKKLLEESVDIRPEIGETRRPIDHSLFEEVAAALGTNKTKVNRWYYQWKRHFETWQRQFDQAAKTPK